LLHLSVPTVNTYIRRIYEKLHVRSRAQAVAKFTQIPCRRHGLKIAGDTVVVTSGQVAAPVAVRYGWANAPDVNLFNKEGLPASPFRTDVE